METFIETEEYTIETDNEGNYFYIPATEDESPIKIEMIAKLRFSIHTFPMSDMEDIIDAPICVEVPSSFYTDYLWFDYDAEYCEWEYQRRG